MNAHPPEDFEQHRPRLLRAARRLLGSTADAEDAVQETWLRWQDAETGALRSGEAWLVTVLTRLCIDQIRQRANEHERTVAWQQTRDLQRADLSPEGLAEQRSALQHALGLALDRLGTAERHALLLREVFELDYAELARQLKLSEAACRQLVHRARERVREHARQTPAPRPRDPAVQALLQDCLRAIRNANQPAMMAALRQLPSAERPGGITLTQAATGPQWLLQLDGLLLATLPLNLFEASLATID